MENFNGASTTAREIVFLSEVTEMKNLNSLIPRIFRVPTMGIDESIRRYLRTNASIDTRIQIKSIAPKYRGILRGIARKAFELLTMPIEVRGIKINVNNDFFEVIDEKLGLPIVRINKRTFVCEVLVEYKGRRFYVRGINL